MPNLYGIESEDVCCTTIDGLLEMTRRAEKIWLRMRFMP